MNIMLSENNDSLVFSFQPFFFFFLPCIKTSNTILNRNSDSSHAYFIPVSGNILQLTVMFGVDFFVDTLDQIKEVCFYYYAKFLS